MCRLYSALHAHENQQKLQMEFNKIWKELDFDEYLVKVSEAVANYEASINLKKPPKKSRL